MFQSEHSMGGEKVRGQRRTDNRRGRGRNLRRKLFQLPRKIVEGILSLVIRPNCTNTD